MKKLIASIAPETRVAVNGFASLGTIVARVAQNTYSVKLDDGRELAAVARVNLGRWDAQAMRAFRF